MRDSSKVLFSCLLFLSVVPALVSIPLGASQGSTTISSLATFTSQISFQSTSTSIVGVGQQTTIQTTSATVTGILAATNGTVGCVYDVQGLSGGVRGQNVSLTLSSLNPVDIYFLSKAAFQSWLNAGHICTQINNVLLSQLNVSGSFSTTVALPADGDYEILVLNRASNAKAGYTITISFGKSAIVDVTTYSTVTESSVQSTVLTETLMHTEEVQGLFSGQNSLLIAVGIVVVVLLVAVLAFKARSGKKTPQTQTAASQVVGKRFCLNCGAELHPNKKFCGKCGKPVS